MEIISRHNKPCPKCGGTDRYIKRNRCAPCYRTKANKARIANPEAAAKRNKEWKAANRARVNQCAAEESRRNGKARSSRWKKENKGKVNYYMQTRRAKQAQACPEWLSEEDKKTIQGFYLMAQRLTECLGIPHHVDHIHPLNGKNFRGLHVPWNLQVIPAKVNLSKGNKLEANSGNFFKA